jgi:hypothetical protein
MTNLPLTHSDERMADAALDNDAICKVHHVVILPFAQWKIFGHFYANVRPKGEANIVTMITPIGSMMNYINLVVAHQCHLQVELLMVVH